MRIVLLFSLFIFASCSVERRAVKKLSWIEYKAPEKLAEKCASKYPTKTNTLIEKEYLPGSVDTIFEDVLLDCDTVTELRYKDRIIKVPMYRTRKTDTIKITQIDTIENTAKIDFLELSLKDLNIEKAVLDTKYKTARKRSVIFASIALGLLLLLGFGFYFKSKF